MSDAQPNPLQLLHDNAGCCKPKVWQNILIGPEPCPECAQGKHGNCDGTAWDDESDGEAVCPCQEAGHGHP